MVHWNTSSKNEARKQPKSRLKALVDLDGEVQVQAKGFRNHIEIFSQSCSLTYRARGWVGVIC